MTRAEKLEECGIRVELYDARIPTGNGVRTVSKHVFGPAPIPAEFLERIRNVPDEELLLRAETDGQDPLARRRREAGAELDETVRRIIGAIHERFAFSTSVLVLVILGAALGIIFRGSHVMTAFGISFVPLVFVIVGIVTGRQMAHNVDTHVMGLATMWSGIVAAAALDVWILARVLRR